MLIFHVQIKGLRFNVFLIFEGLTLNQKNNFKVTEPKIVAERFKINIDYLITENSDYIQRIKLEMSNRNKRNNKAGRDTSSSPQRKNIGKKKSHTKFRAELHQGTPYLKSIIESDQHDACRFICLACKESIGKNYDGYCENLKVHLKSDQHKDTLIPIERLNQHQSSLKHLEKEDNNMTESSQGFNSEADILGTSDTKIPNF